MQQNGRQRVTEIKKKSVTRWITKCHGCWIKMYDGGYKVQQRGLQGTTEITSATGLPTVTV